MIRRRKLYRFWRKVGRLTPQPTQGNHKTEKRWSKFASDSGHATERCIYLACGRVDRRINPVRLFSMCWDGSRKIWPAELKKLDDSRPGGNGLERQPVMGTEILHQSPQLLTRSWLRQTPNNDFGNEWLKMHSGQQARLKCVLPTASQPSYATPLKPDKGAKPTTRHHQNVPNPATRRLSQADNSMLIGLVLGDSTGSHVH